jgi:MoaA/NifB/PqqE/SkfB family radical SAM enzyme
MSNFLCAAPWKGLHINPRGDIKTCCAGDPNLLGNLNTLSIESVLQGPVMQEIRQSLRRGEPHPTYCQNCVQAERYGRSERDWHNRMNPGFDAAQASDIEHAPVLIDLRWNTTCNLSCNYCNEHSSSRWADLKKIPFQSGARPYYEQVCEYLEQHSGAIKKVALIGGEPLLLKENERLLDVIPADCQVDLITNLSVDLSTNRIFAKLSQRQRVGWNVSLDNTGNHFEFVRYGGSWSQIERNIAILKATGHQVGIHPLYSIYNATRLQDLLDWTKSIGLSTHWQSLYHPECLDPLKLGPAIQQLALAELQQVLARTDLDSGERGFLQQAAANYAQPTSANLIDHFRAHLDKIETEYHVGAGKFHDLWPEISNML